MLELSPLSPLTAPRYAALTFSAYRPSMEWLDGRTGLVGVGASDSGAPAGLALGREVAPRSARILSLYVLPDFRGRGIGTSLLAALESHLAGRGNDRMELVYAIDAPGSPAFEGVLHRCGWPGEGDRLQVFTVDGRIMSAPWFDDAVLPSPYAISDWVSLTDEEREALARSQEKERWIPDLLLPFDHEKHLEPLNSLVLRHRGRVAGWLLTHPLDTETIHYANLYVRPSVNRVGRTFASLALLAEAVRRQERAMGVASCGRFEVLPTNAPLLRFIERHLAPYLCSRSTVQRLVKRLDRKE
jgi:ribosomal protein S18 acetylase RimI-like enzyme